MFPPFPADLDGRQPLPPIGSTAVAIDKDKHSPFAVQWAIDNILAPNATLVLLHVSNRSRISIQHLDYLGANDSDYDVNSSAAEADLQQIFGPFQNYCARKGVMVKEVVLDDIDVSKAILNYISKNFISAIALGASNRSVLAKKFKNHDVPTILNKYAPDFCSVYVIAKGKSVTSIRPAINGLAAPRQTSQRGFQPHLAQDASKPEDVERSYSMKGGGEKLRRKSFTSHLSMDSDISNQGAKHLSNCNPLADDGDSVAPHKSGSMDINFPNLDFTNIAENPKDDSPPSSSNDLEAEMKRLRLDLRQTVNMYNTACKEASTAKRKAQELHQWKMEETFRFEQARLAEEAALAIAEKEKIKSKAALEAAEKAQKLAEVEAQRRKLAELKVKQEMKEKNRALDVLSQNDVRCRKYSIEEIEMATDCLSGSLKIGEGGYGPVYKGKLDHTPVAIKVLRSDAKQGKKQFQQEVEILSCIRHPNLVLLLGACPEYGCLVYEYMNYGSLEDRLFRKGNTPPIPWRIRFKIAADIATGLLFLHQTKPEALVHRDLKPGNILLDQNCMCKISDVGLARLVPPSVADSITQYHMTSAAGTFCYIDPEYQQTGKLGTKSDIYSLGIMFLQILTARPPMGLSHHVEKAIQNGIFADLLDPTVPDWPVELALQFAKLSLNCCDLRKRDRPDLGTTILPELIRLKELGAKSRSSGGEDEGAWYMKNS